ncbi:DoxX family protein [Nonomuraea wenchangensis]
MNTALWIVAGLLAALFLLAGGGKLLVSKKMPAEASGAQGWVKDVNTAFVGTFGALEILGAIGLILPAVTGIAPILVPLAATGLATIMVGAVILRIRRHDATKPRSQGNAAGPVLSRPDRLRGHRLLRPRVLRQLTGCRGRCHTGSPGGCPESERSCSS